MEKNKVSVIGEKYMLDMFKLAGVDGYEVYGEEDTRKTLLELSKQYSLIFIFSNFARFASDLIDEINKEYSTICILPTNSFDSYPMQRLNEQASKIMMGHNFS